MRENHVIGLWRQVLWTKCVFFLTMTNIFKISFGAMYHYVENVFQYPTGAPGLRGRKERGQEEYDRRC